MERFTCLRFAVCALALVAAASCESPSGSAEPGPPARLEIVSGEGQAATVGGELPQPLVVRVVDASGVPVPELLVSFQVTAGGGRMLAGAAETDANGEARDRWRLGTVAGDTQRVEVRALEQATGGELLVATFIAVGTAEAPAEIAAIGATARQGIPGERLSDSLIIRVTDRYGNPVPGAPIAWTVRSGGGTLSPQSSATDAHGLARAAWTLGARADTVHVAEASAGGSLRVAFTATVPLPADVQIVKLSGDRQAGRVGERLPLPLRVSVRRSDGRPVGGTQVTWSTGEGGASVTPATTTTDAQGQATADWTLGGRAGEQLAIASVGSAVTPATFVATAAEGVAAALVIASGDRQQGSPGTVLPQPIVVRAQDVHGNPVAGVPVQWMVVAGGGSVTPSSSTTGADGTAATQWALGSAGGPQQVQVSSGSLAPVTFVASTTASGIRLAVRLPQIDSIVGDTVSVVARVISTPTSIRSITATIADRVVDLVGLGGGESAGYLILTGLPRGPATLTVRALGLNGDSAVVQVRVFKDAPPRVVVASPVSNTVARPEVRVDVECTDDGPGCTVEVYADEPRRLLVRGTSAVHETVSLAGYEGDVVGLDIVGVDPGGRGSTQFRRVYVESSPRWSEIATAGVKVLDLDQERVLFTAEDGSFRIRGREGGAETILLGPDPTILVGDNARGWLYRQGAIFTPGNGMGDVYDWRGGPLAVMNAVEYTLRVQGEWAAWSRLGPAPHEVLRRDLRTGTTMLVANDAGARFLDVAPDGAVVYSNSSHDIVRFRDGVLTQLTADDDNVQNANPVTDGMNVVFARHVSCCVGSRLGAQSVLITRSGDQLQLTPPGEGGFGYAAENGWVAFTRLDAAGIPQIWTRAPDGAVRQATRLGTASTLRALGRDGEVVFASDERVYVTVAPYQSPAVDVGSVGVEPTFIWREGGLVALVGRSAFAVSY